MPNENENTPTVLTDKVKNFKEIARNALRMNLITPRLTNISGLEKEIERIEKCTKETTKDITVYEYELEKLDQDHPRYKETKECLENRIKDAKEDLKEHEEPLKELAKSIKEQEERIEKIETGKTLVSKEELNEVVLSLINEDAHNQVD